jgi:phage internal scaffolding protein
MVTKVKIKNRFSPSERIPYEAGQGAAQQQFKDQCDLNLILKKFKATGVINHVARGELQQGICPSITLHEAMNTVAHANTMFEELPSQIRKRFNNDPVSLMAFLENPKNKAEAVELGILTKDPDPDPYDSDHKDPDPKETSEPPGGASPEQ